MPDYAIETENLTKVFTTRWPRRALTAVDNISLRVPSGSTYGLLGPNGAGKTTFVKMLLSVAHPTTGRAVVFGRDSREPAARAPIGYLPENHRFPTYLTGWGMLDFYGALSGMSASDRRRRIPKLLDQTGLDERTWHLRLGKYSKGMLQRVGLAQALMHAPKLLVLDEPSDGVDPVGRKQIREVLHTLEQQGVTIFLNSHLLAEVEPVPAAEGRDYPERQTGAERDWCWSSRAWQSGYRLEIAGTPETLETELCARARTATAVDGTLNLIFATCELANQLARSGARQWLAKRKHLAAVSRSTLEEVFMKYCVEGE